MNPLRKSLVAVAAAGSLFAAAIAPAWAGPSAYQATGTVLAISDTLITIQKGKEKWEIARDTGTQAPADIKVGDKVTVHYTMTATGIDASKAPVSESKAKGKSATAKASATPGASGTTEASKPGAEPGPAASPATTP